MSKIFKILILSFILTGCVAVGNQTLEVENKISQAKVIAVNVNTGGPWMREIERRLKKEGFKVLRAASVNEAIEVSGKKLIKYNEASTRYFLRVDAAAPTDAMRRCFGGGYNFDYFYADLIDLESNETIASIESRGYSEGCQPLAGKIFTNTTLMVVNSWN
tara:strand:- start:83 stop:565 length:483 start_codon:yes stop_codon:yes gene_type:complete